MPHARRPLLRRRTRLLTTPSRRPIVPSGQAERKVELSVQPIYGPGLRGIRKRRIVKR